MIARSMFVLLALCAGCSHDASPRKESLARLHPLVLPGSATVSHDGAHHAYLVRDTDGTRMVRDGVASENYRDATNRSYAPTSARHVYWARGFDDQPLLVVDDSTIPIGYSRHEYVTFDPTGTHWAALAKPAGGEGAVVLRDGVALGPFSDASVPAWSPEGALAYLRVQGLPGLPRTVELVVGDAVVRSAPAMSPTCVPMLGEPFEGPELPRHAIVRYLSDGRLLTLMPQQDGWALTRGEERLGTFDASAPTAAGTAGPYVLAGTEACNAGSVIAASTVTAADQAPVVAWWERTPGADGWWRVVVDGVPASPLRCLRPWPHQPPLLSSDGRGVAFPCVTRFDDHGEAIMVVHGDREYGPYPEVWALALSDDGQRIAYGTSDGSLDLGWAVYADGVPQSERYYGVWRPRFDPSGRHLAWEAMRSVDGPNVLVLDGRPLATFDDLLDGPVFDREGEVAWFIRRGRRLARLNFPLAP